MSSQSGRLGPRDRAVATDAPIALMPAYKRGCTGSGRRLATEPSHFFLLDYGFFTAAHPDGSRDPANGWMSACGKLYCGLDPGFRRDERGELYYPPHLVIPVLVTGTQV